VVAEEEVEDEEEEAAAREGEAREWPTAEGETKASSTQRPVSWRVCDDGSKEGREGQMSQL
jgi:hypothetical protein